MHILVCVRAVHYHPGGQARRRCRGCRRGCGAGSRAVFPAAVQKAGEIINSTPDNHFAAAPECGVTESAFRRVGRCSSHPVIRARLVSTTGTELLKHVSPAPNDHVSAGPHCRVTKAVPRRVGRAGGNPTIGARIISATAVNPEFRAIVTRPDDHFIAGPYSRVKLSSRGRARRGCGHPTIGERIVSPAGVEEANIVINSAPDNHFVASPDRGM